MPYLPEKDPSELGVLDPSLRADERSIAVVCLLSRKNRTEGSLRIRQPAISLILQTIQFNTIAYIFI